MKSTIQLLTLLLALNSVMLFAADSTDFHGFSETKAGPATSKKNTHLALNTNNITEVSATINNTAVLIARLAPVTPSEADFEETEDISSINITTLAPSTHSMPDFEETDYLPASPATSLSPCPPSEADFTE
jgi:hypothetical protein